MLIRESISSYRHLDFGNIKLAFTQICKDELFKDIYFAANALYYVESGSAILYSGGQKVTVNKGEVAGIRQHSKLDIKKFKENNGRDFRSVIFYLFPDFVAEFLSKPGRDLLETEAVNIVHLGKDQALRFFIESFLPLFDQPSSKNNHSILKQKTFEAIDLLSKHNNSFIHFLRQKSNPVKIDLFEFMIHNWIQPYSVNELARLTGRSISAFKRDFKSIFETTPHQWILNKKIDYAGQLLTEMKMKPSDIYVQLGFNELSHFSSAFKKIKGIAPSHV